MVKHKNVVTQFKNQKEFADYLRKQTLTLAEQEINLKNFSTESIKHVQEYVDKNMDRYIDTLSLVPDMALNKKLNILDIGISYGLHDVILKRIGYQMYGTELASRIEKNCVLPLNEGIPIKDLDLTKSKLPFKNEFFDIILFGEVLEHVRDSPVKVLTQLKKLIKPGGFLILTTPNFCRITNIGMIIFKRNPLEPFDLKYDSENNSGHITDSWTHIREYNKTELINIMKKAGFRIEKIEMSMCWDSYKFNFRYGDYAKGKKGASLILFILNKILKDYRSNIMILAKKPQ
ncbi:MAG: class I SAM-dependent methyltransferase [Thermoplasmata archaeon]|nr:MAG: class I SAM-dependent methyltransferase [Thermoplasmata archaeon]